MINVQIDTTKEGKGTLKVVAEGTADVLADECIKGIWHMARIIAKTLERPLEEVAMMLGVALSSLPAWAQEQEERSKDEGKKSDDERIKESVEELLRESGACRGDNAESTDD